MGLRSRVNPWLDIERYEPAADLVAVNMGPQHPSTHGVFRLKLFLDGEVVVKAVPYAGYLHRGVEKLCEKLTVVQIVPVLDKNDYLAPMTNEQAFVHCVEEMLGIEVPRRARYLRCLLAELNRIASHLLWLATFTLDIGGTIGGGASMMMYAFQERERFFDLFEALTGSRFHHNTHCVGGNRHDPPPGWDRQVREVLALADRRVRELAEHCSGNGIFDARTRGIGTIGTQLALELGLTGPNLRASGIDHDLRRDRPYFAYDELVVKVATAEAGDCHARYTVRLAEMHESIRLASALIDGLPEGPLAALRPARTPTAVKLPAGQHYAAIESPRGELGTFLIGGGDHQGASPYRCKLRPPSLHALSALPWVLPGHTVSDVVAILGSLDPIIGEVDR